MAKATGVCLRTIRKWMDRYRREGLTGLHDRSSRPHRLRRPMPAATIETIERLRRHCEVVAKRSLEISLAMPLYEFLA
ncbi:helix-turn-helix domain-containing protein [Sinorhizobium meliloti]|nr:helix-turn-helix domain-containing protein [Sinorhizobium meliloti]